ncbi:MAG: Peptidoglycan-binding protein ArfA [Stenotrophomonas maltophilia]|nr:MAG: Peptidoglycan-binding protein ArfA [Stenotrophomonas maltophilia]
MLERQGFVLSEEGWRLGLSGKVLFGNNDATLNPVSAAELQRIGHALLSVGIQRLRLEGHTDAYGERDYNQQLSERRAQAVAEALAIAGIPRDGMQVIGRGMDVPVADNADARGRSENRRVAIIVPAS